MKQWKPSGRSITATAAAATTGSGLALLVLLVEPNPVLEWMRVITIAGRSAQPPGAILAGFLVLACLAAFGVTVLRWLFRRLRISGASSTFVAVLLLAFLVAFAAETASQALRAWGNLTTSDATGLLFEDARLTAHGWTTIARRALFAAAVSGLMALSFWWAGVGWQVAKSRR